jgi:phosphoribosylamine--glycine ligase
MGTSMLWTGRNDLFERTLGRLEGWLAAEGYVGSIDLNCIVNESGVFPLEFTPRFGYPTITLQEESFECPTGAFFHDLAHGADPELRVHSGYQVCARVVLPPFPFDDPETYEENSRNAAVVFDTDEREGVHIEDAKRVDGQWRVAGENGMPLVLTGKGETMGAARAQLYDRVDDVLLPNCYYRDDIGERWLTGEGDRLQSWGYLGPAVASG